MHHSIHPGIRQTLLLLPIAILILMHSAPPDIPSTSLFSADSSFHSSFLGFLLPVTAAFVHPGLLSTQADFDRMRDKVAAGQSPWKDAWTKILTNPHANNGWTPHPTAILCRTSDTTICSNNYIGFEYDISAAYVLALKWKIVGDAAAANRSIYIMNQWSATLTNLTGNNDMHLLSIPGFQLGCAAEILRDYPYWLPADFLRFQNMLLTIFLPVALDGIDNLYSNVHVWSNWQLASTASLISISVLCERQDLFDKAVNTFKYAAGSGNIRQAVWKIHPGFLGQTEETGRDAAHNQLSVMLNTNICEMAWNQGVDLYGWDNNRALAGSEYNAKYNIFQKGSTLYAVPYLHYVQGVYNLWSLGTLATGQLRPQYAMVFHHYQNRMGIAAPWSKKASMVLSPEGGGGDFGPNSGGYDQLGFTTLTHARDPWTQDGPAQGLESRFSLGIVTLSWWGGVTATSFSVLRSNVTGGPYQTVASGIRELLTYADPIAKTANGTYYYVIQSRHLSGAVLNSIEYQINLSTAGYVLNLEFNEGGANLTTIDQSGFGWNGPLSLSGTTWVASKTTAFGLAIAMDGISGGVSLPNGLFRDVGDFTITLWMYWQGLNNGTQALFYFGSTDNNNALMFLTPKWTDGKAKFLISTNDIDGADWTQPGAPFGASAWNHIAVTILGNLATVYYNGVSWATNTQVRWLPSDLALGNTTYNMIGQGPTTYFPQPFIGKMDKFRIYRGGKTTAEILALYTTGA